MAKPVPVTMEQLADYGEFNPAYLASGSDKPTANAGTIKRSRRGRLLFATSVIGGPVRYLRPGDIVVAHDIRKAAGKKPNEVRRLPLKKYVIADIVTDINEDELLKYADKGYQLCFEPCTGYTITGDITIDPDYTFYVCGGFRKGNSKLSASAILEIPDDTVVAVLNKKGKPIKVGITCFDA